MRITVHSVAGRLPAWVDQGVKEYEKRLPRELRLSWRTVPVASGQGDNAELQREREGRAILKGLREGEHCIALDGRGRAWSTEELATQLKEWLMGGQDLALLIGGPDGLSSQCLDAAQQRWSLGPLTLPHPLVRVLLAEQLYRAWTITIGHPYHRA
ncbi:MAG: 23S rRNA (pseudouridine(1915)-N(3))-methyltransferase RlmH [Halieaceae bacterium]|jgi:23S rRNA (pseudouridine1915-N3)-methyltransferase|nr:23S rRNA (pseudouridine(1915)-N(3))-methyltransferase RlmH [Halieaceae bacterium]